MTVSPFNSEASAGGESAQRGDNGRGRPQAKQPGWPRSSETPFWEQITGLIGLLMVLGVLGFLLVQALQPEGDPMILFTVDRVEPKFDGYVVRFTASNRGHATAAAVELEGALYVPGESEDPVETAGVTFDYIPEQSDRTGTLVFIHDPRKYDLRMQLKGFMDP